MQPEDPQTPAEAYVPSQRVGNDLSVMQPGERVICNIKRHPIGIIAIYVAIGFMLAVSSAAVFGGLPSLASSSASKDSITAIGAAAFFMLTLGGFIYALIATKVYWGNKWVVTSDSVTQINQRSLFKRESAQLAMGNIEDVTAEQNGILAHVFNYGVIKVETAGHREKFVFLFCPNPNFYAQQILTARETVGQTRPGQAA